MTTFYLEIRYLKWSKIVFGQKILTKLQFQYQVIVRSMILTMFQNYIHGNSNLFSDNNDHIFYVFVYF